MAEVHARSLSAILAMSLVAVGLATISAGCSTDAQGVDTCRTIEEERCRQALACPDQFHLTTQRDVDECVRFYRDQCLHGLTGSDVGGPQLDQCVQTIRKAGECAASGGKVLADCPNVSQETAIAVTPCDLVAHPEEAIECSFLGPPPAQPTFDAATEQPPSEDGAAPPDGADEAATSDGATVD